MIKMNGLGGIFAGAMAATLLAAPPQAAATVVEFQTTLGNFRVNLFDQTTPATVANFLNYVNNGAYTQSFIHRSEPGFVVQGGGFIYDGSLQFSAVAQNGSIPQNAPVVNEPELTNARGTIAMAKLANNPDSATSQWFFNLVDNASGLDGQNGGFTVFGIVIEDGLDGGMDVVDAIAALDRFDLSGPFAALPLRNDPMGADPVADDLVIVSSIVVTDTTVNTGASLLPATNVIANPPVVTPPPATSGGGGGGGAPGPLLVLGLLTVAGFRWRFVTAQARSK